MRPDSEYRPSPNQRRTRFRLRTTLTGAAVVAVAVAGGFLSRGASANDVKVNVCADVPNSTRQLTPEEQAQFQGDPPPGCKTWGQYADELDKQGKDGKIIEGTGQDNTVNLP